MTEDASFKIKSLSDLLSENQEARNQVLHKQELYPFVMRLLNESKSKTSFIHSLCAFWKRTKS